LDPRFVDDDDQHVWVRRLFASKTKFQVGGAPFQPLQTPHPGSRRAAARILKRCAIEPKMQRNEEYGQYNAQQLMAATGNQR
jgi:hypothetical protein